MENRTRTQCNGTRTRNKRDEITEISTISELVGTSEYEYEYRVAEYEYEIDAAGVCRPCVEKFAIKSMLRYGKVVRAQRRYGNDRINASRYGFSGSLRFLRFIPGRVIRNVSSARLDVTALVDFASRVLQSFLCWVGGSRPRR